MNNSIVLGVDIGGSHITAALVNLESRSVTRKTLVRRQVNSNGSREEIVSMWCSVLEEVFSHQDLTEKRIGIAMPGPFDYDAGISRMRNQNKYDALYGQNIKELIAVRLGIEPCSIRFINDAQSFLEGEVFGGAGKGFKRAIGLTLGTGLGSARYIDGHSEDADLWCSPFLDGIAEDYLSTRWFIKRFHELTGTKVEDVRELVSLQPSDDRVQVVFDEFGKNLGIFLNDFISKNHPDTVILGGNIANAYSLFSASLMERLSDLPLRVPVQKTLLGEEACLIGAASCWHKSQLQHA